ncbi:MAG: adenylyl-sulfate kinase [Rhodospirillaceae bacterium]|jgi:bifunctional enzyme CysN/CysC|nr:adenylyl-sulfate kinase [Rhodospirillaceae bacterium]MBT5192488.1 adenylyl-sulfate kinase [Rhodospirillaceae bacterium]MBT7759007.1 adenylyl-sulfate kinase [Rhodospirillaceae bacterium]
MSSTNESLKVAIVGHVDHGKSTLVGRLFHDTGSLPEGKFEAIKAMCDRRGMPFEWAFLMDALQAERDQGVTIDTSQIWFRTEKRGYVIIDAPGHKEFLKNMITGAAASDAALLLIDAEEGIREQSRRHGYLLHLLGVRQVMVAVNKMDLIDYDRDRFEAIENEYRDYLRDIGVTPTHFIPVSARQGDNIANPSEDMAWYRGPTVLRALDDFQVVTQPDHLPLRFPVQDVYRFDERRIIAGRIETGTLKVGDTLLFSPANRAGKVKSIEAWSVAEQRTQAGAGESVGITLEEQIFVERGDVASHDLDPPIESDVFRARLFWLGDREIRTGNRYTMKLNSTDVGVVVQSIERVIDTTDLSTKEAAGVARNEVAEITLRSDTMLALDDFTTSPHTGRFVLVDDYKISGGGIISMEGYADQRHLITRRASNIQRVEHDVTNENRQHRNGHKGAVLWFTGLSGAGKSTVAVAVERRLFNLGYQTYVLDGDNVRHGLNADLGFSPEDRAENIRRVGEVAGLISRAGMICITAFISPYRSDRDRARRAGGDQFAEIYIEADLATCEQRDPKGLYKKARAGEIPDFTGISAPYEAPDDPELVVDTSNLSVDEAVERVVAYIQERFVIDTRMPNPK